MFLRVNKGGSDFFAGDFLAMSTGRGPDRRLEAGIYTTSATKYHAGRGDSAESGPMDLYTAGRAEPEGGVKYHGEEFHIYIENRPWVIRGSLKPC